MVETHLHDEFRGIDMRPFHRHTEPIVGRTPSARTSKDIVFATIEEFSVYPFYLISDGRIVGCREILVCLDVNHVHEVFVDTVSERHFRTDKHRLIVFLRQCIFEIRRQVDVQFQLGIDYRTYLEQIKLDAAVGIDIASKLYLHRSAHRIRTIFHRHLHHFRYRSNAILQHSSVGNHLSAAFIESIADDLVVRVIGRDDVHHCAIIHICLLHAYILYIKAVIHFEILIGIVHVNGIKHGLGFLQSHVHLAHLQHLPWVIRAYSQRSSAIDDIFSESES